MHFFKNISLNSYILVVFLITWSLEGSAEDYFQDSDSSVQIISESYKANENEILLIGFKFILEPGWHTYWANPGDAGEGATVIWNLPNNVSASNILWPGPEAIPVEPLMTFGYEDEAIILSELSIDKGAIFPIKLEATVGWYTCKEICVPQQANIKTTIFKGERVNSIYKDEILRAQSNLPIPLKTQHRVKVFENSFILQFEVNNDAKIDDIYFFPEKYGLINYSQTQKSEINKSSISLEIPKAELSLQNNKFKGVLQITEDSKKSFYSIDYPLENSTANIETLSLGTALLFAFLGGLILNIMPCVFPILSIKILSFVEQSRGSSKELIKHGVAFSVGVLLTFLTIAGVLISLKAGGEAIGWGFQLQYPLVVSLLAYLFVAIGSVLIGNLVIVNSFAQVGQFTSTFNNLTGSFLTGVLAVIVASPCTAPFMGSAIGIALIQPSFTSLLIFIGLGFGFAFPYLILSFNPKLMTFLPKPGKWMETFKEFMAFPMWLSALWLIWVLSSQIESQSLILVILGCILVGLSVWMLDKTQEAKAINRFALYFISIILVILSIYLLPTSYGKEKSEIKEFSISTLEELREAEETILVNFTADWCITCKVNEAVVLSSNNFKKILIEGNIHYLLADWTRKDEEIANTLERYGRTGVPLYLLFFGKEDAIILPELLTEEILLTYLNKKE